jgi:hypothetical protein
MKLYGGMEVELHHSHRKIDMLSCICLFSCGTTQHTRNVKELVGIYAHHKALWV